MASLKEFSGQNVQLFSPAMTSNPLILATFQCPIYCLSTWMKHPRSYWKPVPPTCAGGAIPSHLLKGSSNVSPLLLSSSEICMPLHYPLHHTNILLFLPSKTTTTHFYWSSSIFTMFFGPLLQKAHWRVVYTPCLHSISLILSLLTLLIF